MNLSRMRYHSLIAALCGLMLLVGCNSDRSEKSGRPAITETAATVSEIIDGDTFMLSSGKVIRIAAVDAPEKGEALYDVASGYLTNMTLGRQVILKPIGPGRDRYGRILAEVYVDSVNVGMSILRDGMGLLYLFPDDVHLKEKYLPELLRAKQNKRGIWSLPAPVAEDYYINVSGSYRFHRPLCLHLKRVNSDKLQRIDSRDQAIALGFSPCRRCKP